MTEELFREDGYLKSCEARVVGETDDGVILDRTVFYPMGGGQPGDTGALAFVGGEAQVVDTRKSDDGIVHVLGDNAQRPQVGDTVTAIIDWERRYKHMRMHTALHLLCASVDGQITGAQVGADKSRIDFNIPESPDKDALNAALERLIADDRAVTIRSITDAELDAQPDLVRTMSVAPPRGSGRVRVIDIVGADMQPCGGTHVSRTGEIGRVRVGKIENKGKQNRRINIVFED